MFGEDNDQEEDYEDAADSNNNDLSYTTVKE